MAYSIYEVEVVAPDELISEDEIANSKEQGQNSSYLICSKLLETGMRSQNNTSHDKACKIQCLYFKRF